jgi:hypothetical protein
MHRDMVRLIAFDFILRLIRVGVMRVSFVVDVVCVNPDNPAADTSGLGIPGHVIADLETFLHVRLLTHRITPPRSAVSPRA